MIARSAATAAMSAARAMALVERHTTIAAPLALVYRVSQDYTLRHDWDPFPASIAVVAGEPGGPHIGTRVHIRSRLGMDMLVEFVQVAPPTHAAVKMIRGPWFLARFAGSWIFHEVTPGTTAARFRYTLTARPALLRFLIEPVAALYFSRVASKRLDGLRACCERLGDPRDAEAVPSR